MADIVELKRKPRAVDASVPLDEERLVKRDGWGIVRCILRFFTDPYLPTVGPTLPDKERGRVLPPSRLP